MFDFVGKAKWAAWNKLQGMDKKTAMANYICLANEIDPQISIKIQNQLTPEEDAKF